MTKQRLIIPCFDYAKQSDCPTEPTVSVLPLVPELAHLVISRRRELGTSCSSVLQSMGICLISSHTLILFHQGQSCPFQFQALSPRIPISLYLSATPCLLLQVLPASETFYYASVYNFLLSSRVGTYGCWCQPPSSLASLIVPSFSSQCSYASGEGCFSVLQQSIAVIFCHTLPALSLFLVYIFC